VLVWPALAVLYVVWGSTYLGIRITIETLPPLLTASTRFLTAGLILTGISWLAGEWRPPPNRRQVLNCAAVGLLLFAGGNGLVVISEERIPSGITSLFVAMSPLFVAAISFVGFGQRPGRWQLVGLVLGLLGLIVLTRPSGARSLDPLGAAEALLSAVFWSAGSLYASRARLPSAPPVAASLQMLFGGLGQLVVALLRQEPAHAHLQTASLRSLGALLYLIVFGSLIAFTTYAWLVRTAPLSLLLTYVYVNPVVALTLGALLLGERPTSTELLGAAIVLCGVALIVTGQAVVGRRRQTGIR
jgi:drug/metabolite transporter (DMT)-like permease